MNKGEFYTKKGKKYRWNKSKIINTKNLPMQSQKKLKIPSLLSLPSLSSLSPSKKHLLKPLQLSDIIVMMVGEQLAVDKTKEFKSYLTKNRKQTISLDQQEELIRSPLGDLPDFAKKQWGFGQLLKYHIDRKRDNVNEEIAKWERMLSEIQKEFTNSLEKYKYELEEGKDSIEQIQTNVDLLYQTTLLTKQHIRHTNAKIKKFSKQILVNIRKQQNLSKTIAIAKAWSKSNISRILSQNLNTIETLDINKIMKDIDNCVNEIKLQGANKELDNFDKVLKVIEERRNLIIQKVEKNMLLSIVDFVDHERYSRIYVQYNQLLRSLAWSNEEKFLEYHQLEKGNLQAMIQQNVDLIYWSSLESVSTVNNIELLRQETYTSFFQCLIQNYNSYIVKWHKVTSFHVNSNTSHKQNFIKMLEDVAKKIIKKVFHLIKYSQKFFSLSFAHKIKVVLEIDRLVVFLEQWTEKKDLSLFQVLKEKIRTEIENFRKETNGFVKVLFVEEFSEDGLMPKMKRKTSGDDKEHIKGSGYRNVGSLMEDSSFLTQKDNQLRKVREIVRTKLFSQNDEDFLPQTNKDSPIKNRSKQNIQSSQQSNNDDSQRFKEKIRQLSQQQFDLQLSKTFIKSITQYCERQQILPFGHLQYILEHLEFLILLIFKVCVHQDIKAKLIQDFSPRPFSKLKEVELMIGKNPSEQTLMPNLSKMRESFMIRRNYLELHHFLSQEIDSKFDNLVISGFISINKLYTNPNENAQILNNYHGKVAKLVEELLVISRWLINNQSYFSSYQKNSKKLDLLPTVLIQLAFLYFQQYNVTLYHKYIQTIEPLMKNLKWKIEKFNQEVTLQFREYKINILQIYRSSSLNVGIKDKELHEQLTNKHLEVFYKALLYLYCRIDKINDNGRQVLRLDVIEISKILTEVGYNPGSWGVWFEKFIECTMDRSMKSILEKIQQLGVVYPIFCWKSHLLWVVNNLSTKQKKEYTTHLYKIYVDQLQQLPEL